MSSVTVNGRTYTDDADPDTGLAGGGHRKRLIPMLADVVAFLSGYSLYSWMDGLTPVAGSVPYFVSGSGTPGLYSTSAWFRNSWASLNNAEAAHTLLGLASVAKSGSAADLSTGTIQDARLPGRIGVGALIITSADTISATGDYSITPDGVSNPVPGSYTHIRHSQHGESGLWATQVAWAFAADSSADTQTWRREKNNNVWSAWYRLRLSQSEQAILWAPVGAIPSTGGNLTGILSTTSVFRSAFGDATAPPYSFTSSAGTGIFGPAAGQIGFSASGSHQWTVSSAAFFPAVDNTKSIGTASNRPSVIYAGTGTINTSDARFKTTVRAFENSEIEAAKEIVSNVGVYQFLDAVNSKGEDGARLHVGMTVQRVVEIMRAHHLDPMRYGFICFDSWGDRAIHHPAKYEIVKQPDVVDDFGDLVAGAEVQGELIEAEWDEVLPGGDIYGFRNDELHAFLMRGLVAWMSSFDARLKNIENV